MIGVLSNDEQEQSCWVFRSHDEIVFEKSLLCVTTVWTVVLSVVHWRRLSSGIVLLDHIVVHHVTVAVDISVVVVIFSQFLFIRRGWIIGRRVLGCSHYLDSMVDIVGDVLTTTNLVIVSTSSVTEVHIKIMKRDRRMRSPRSSATSLELTNNVKSVDCHSQTQHYQEERDQTSWDYKDKYKVIHDDDTDLWWCRWWSGAWSVSPHHCLCSGRSPTAGRVVTWCWTLSHSRSRDTGMDRCRGECGGHSSTLMDQCSASPAPDTWSYPCMDHIHTESQTRHHQQDNQGNCRSDTWRYKRSVIILFHI